MQLLEAIEKAERMESNLIQEVLDLYGMSSPKVRHFLNNICHGRSYLEIGTHKGSTLISAMYKNPNFGIAYDDYREFGNCYDEAKSKIEQFKINAQLIKADGFTHDKGKFDVIFYDGDHSEESKLFKT